MGELNETSSIECGVWNDEVEEKLTTCSFWMEGVLLTGTGIIGLIGNILSIVILSKPDMYNSFNQLLITLSTMDSIFILLAIVDFSITRAFNWQTKLFIYTFPFIIYPLNNISLAASIFTTVALAYERHTAVCRPIHYRNVTAKYSVRRRTLCYVIPVMLLSVVLNVPKFMESNFTWTPITSYGNNGSTNSSESSIIEYEIGFEVSELREHPDYIKYYTMWTRLITTGIIPLGALIYFNFGIFRGIQMTHERVKKKNKQRASEMNLAAILLCIVFLFLVCHFPRILLNVHELFMLSDMLACGPDFFPPVWFNCFVSFNHLLLIINASCNFLIYVSVGDKFKTTIDKFCQSKGFGCANCFKGSNDHPSSPLMDANHEDGGAPAANVVEENGKAIPLLPVTKPLSTQTISTTVSVTNNGRNQIETVVEVNPIEKRSNSKENNEDEIQIHQEDQQK